MSRWSTWGLLANKAASPTGVNLRTAMALMGDTEIQSQSKADCDSHRLVVKPETTRSDGQSKKPIYTVERRCCQKRCPMVCGNQTLFHKCLINQHTWQIPKWLFGGQYVWNITKLCWPVWQVWLQIGIVWVGTASQCIILEGQCGGTDDTRLTPWPPSLTGRLACVHWMSVRSELVMCWIECLSSINI